MQRLFKFWQVIALDLLGIIFMLAALATGWLPGPGGIPLFLIGLSLLAINHDWAKRYIDLTKKYASRVGDLVFVNNPKVQLLYDIASPLVLGIGIALVWGHTALWQLSLGIFLFFIGLTFGLGNRQRWANFRNRFKH